MNESSGALSFGAPGPEGDITLSGIDGSTGFTGEEYVEYFWLFISNPSFTGVDIQE